MSVELFAKYEIYDFFETKRVQLKEEIKGLSDEKILYTDIEELHNYYLDYYKLQPITLYLDNVKKELSETRFIRHDYYRTDEVIYEDGYKVSFDIPFDGDNSLLYVNPSSRFLNRFNVENIKHSSDTEYGIITFSIAITKDVIKNEINEEYVNKLFTNDFRNTKQMIENVNKDVNDYNSSLQNIIKTALKNRKEKADSFVSLGEKLSIPLKINPNAPNTTPILLKKLINKKPTMPDMKQKENEYSLKDDDYSNIRKIIFMAGTSMEKTARTFNKINEEELRDFILAILNTHYQNMATGETFSKSGKTDIHIPFENKSAYIAECKIWHGEKTIKEAIEQLFSYTTWRDIKTSIIIFNKNNKDFLKVIECVNTFLSNYTICKKCINVKKNEWICEIKKSEDVTEMNTVQIIIFDLFINDKKDVNS